jgi:hypothetical protein
MTNAAPGSELTKEPFRWDQRVFGIVLRMPATPPGEFISGYIPSATDTPLDAMCEVTGGLYLVFHVVAILAYQSKLKNFTINCSCESIGTFFYSKIWY